MKWYIYDRLRKQPMSVPVKFTYAVKLYIDWIKGDWRNIFYIFILPKRRG